MACNIPINFTETATEIINKASSAIKGAGGTFAGNEQNGSFAISTPLGAIKGSYTVGGQTITLNISDKPFLLSCGKIESELKKYLGV